MRLALALALTLITTSARAEEHQPGRGTWIVTEVGASLWHATWTGLNGERSGRGGIDGGGIRVRAGALFEVARGFALGPVAGGDMAFTHASSDLCCGEVYRVDTARLGVEGSYWPDPAYGFRVLFGFGVATAATRVDEEGRKNPGVLGAAYPTGSYFSVGLGRDTKLGPHTRIGGALRIEADHLTTSEGDTRQAMRTLLPSLSIVLLTQ